MITHSLALERCSTAVCGGAVCAATDCHSHFRGVVGPGRDVIGWCGLPPPADTSRRSGCWYCGGGRSCWVVLGVLLLA